MSFGVGRLEVVGGRVGGEVIAVVMVLMAVSKRVRGVLALREGRREVKASVVDRKAGCRMNLSSKEKRYMSARKTEALLPIVMPISCW